ncbi:uncharacterized protein N7459_000284 [Penicillium hispanicum]|uniref:uncharacterized protein n=1 Tax=Penicillium hispanicum TaxID=1080232 RepID=UPI002540555F|nr:uncharacterized protein N7459_000284 [Penicillium hispanicum]KAJ5594076.1 hypothetical protein N7459_000284 [Penicillium hispanicum]
MQASGSDDKEMNEADEATRRSEPVHISSTDLREKLLREKLVAMRRSSSEKVGVTSTDKV